MATTFLTKNELKKQRDSLKLYRRFLPTLQLKKQQIQAVLRGITDDLDRKETSLKNNIADIFEWVGVLGETTGLEEYIIIKNITIDKKNIAGVEVPFLVNVTFEPNSWDLFTTPLWIDTAIGALKELITKQIEFDILKKQVELLHNELVITTQRVNLFEKIQIPKSQELIRRIQIYFADLQTAAVIRGKISKRKMEEYHT